MSRCGLAEATYHLRQASACNDVSSMNQPVKEPSTCLHRFPHVVIKVFIICEGQAGSEEQF
jgi:hypothetical protein